VTDGALSDHLDDDRIQIAGAADEVAEVKASVEDLDIASYEAEQIALGILNILADRCTNVRKYYLHAYNRVRECRTTPGRKCPGYR
jgi:hypothetical protein